MESEQVKKEYILFNSMDLFILCTVINLSPMETLNYIEMLFSAGSLFHAIGFVICIYLVSVATVSVQFFLGEYTRYSYIKIWDIMPCMRGMGYLTVMTSITDILLPSARLFAGTKLMFVSMTMEWETCKIAKDKPCVPIDRQVTFDNCTEPLEISPITFYKTHYPHESGHFEELSTTTIFAVFIVWGVIFGFVKLGIKRLMTTYRYIIIGSYIFTIPPILASLIHTWRGRYRRPNVFSMPSFTTNQIFNYFSKVVFITSCQEKPGLFLFLASRGKLPFEPHSVSVVLYGIKYFVFILITLCLFAMIGLAEDALGIEAKACFKYDDMRLFFGMAPASLYLIGIPKQMAFFWFLFYILWQLPIIIVTVEAAILSISQMHTTKKEYQWIPLFVVCSVCYCLTIIVLRSNHTDVYKLYQEVIRVTMVDLCTGAFSFAIMFYSFETLRTDYQFKYGSAKKMSWALNLKLSFFFHIISVIIDIYKSATNPSYNNSRCIFIAVLCYSPFVIAFLVELKNSKTIRDFVKPRADFGPYSDKDKKDRANYIPSKFEKFLFKDIKKICPHHCIANSYAYQMEVDFTQYKIEYFRKVYHSYIDQSDKESTDM